MHFDTYTTSKISNCTPHIAKKFCTVLGLVIAKKSRVRLRLLIFQIGDIRELTNLRSFKDANV